MDEVGLQNERKKLGKVFKKSVIDTGEAKKNLKLIKFNYGREYFHPFCCEKCFLKTILIAFNLPMFALSPSLILTKVHLQRVK